MNLDKTMNLGWQNALEVIHWITLDQCKEGWLYHIAARNATLGIYRSAKQGFEIRRDKLGSIYRFVEYHWDWAGGEILFGKKLLGTAKPLAEIEQAPALGGEKEFIAYMEARFQELHQV
jgi:hypothetical protein